MDKIKKFIREYSVPICIFAIIIVIILIILWYINMREIVTIYDEIMEGLWIANEEFCASSDIDGMLVFIGPRIGYFSETRKVYIIMFAGNKIAVNEKIEIEISNPFILPILANKIQRQILIVSKNVEKIMPKSMTLTLNIGSGSMTWETEDTVYAELYKDNLSLKSSFNNSAGDVIGEDSEKI